MKNIKFTQEIKDKWLKALKSGKYIQTDTQLERWDFDNKKLHCCIGVLGDILGMDNKTDEPYDFLISNLGNEKMTSIYRMNDSTFDIDKPDYSNVIPYIKTLEVIE